LVFFNSCFHQNCYTMEKMKWNCSKTWDFFLLSKPAVFLLYKRIPTLLVSLSLFRNALNSAAECPCLTWLVHKMCCLARTKNNTQKGALCLHLYGEKKSSSSVRLTHSLLLHFGNYFNGQPFFTNLILSHGILIKEMMLELSFSRWSCEKVGKEKFIVQFWGCIFNPRQIINHDEHSIVRS